MFPRAQDGAQLVGSLPSIACTRPWLPLQHQYGVQVCNPALRRCRQEGSQTQGPPRLAWATRDPVLEKGREDREIHLWQGQAIPHSQLAHWGGRTQSPHSTQGLSFLFLFLLPCCATHPLGSLEEAWHPSQLQQLPTPAPLGDLMGPVNVKWGLCNVRKLKQACLSGS